MQIGDDVFIRAFYSLSTCRQHTDSHVGAIPWRDIIAYAEHREFDVAMTMIFEQVIQAMDGAFLADQDKQAQQRAKKVTRESRDPEDPPPVRRSRLGRAE